jgi:hypothetical protein
MKNKTTRFIPDNQRFTCEVHFDPNARDTYPNNFKCWVRIQDRLLNQTLRRRGYGRFIGNFSPIWVNVYGKKYQLTELERITI